MNVKYISRVPTFSDWQNSIIFPGFFLVNFQVFFPLFLKYDIQVVLNTNMQTYWVSFEQKWIIFIILQIREPSFLFQ